MSEEEVKPTPTVTAESPEAATVPSNSPEEAPTISSATSQPSAPKTDEAQTATSTTQAPAEPPEEPQNDLTRKFTAQEWTALKTFRTQLPDIFAEAFPDKPDAKATPITIWNITVHPTKFDDARISVVLMKFLRARYLNPSAAREMMVSTLRWRDMFKPEETLKEEFPEDVFKGMGYVFGKDKDGHPITYNIYGNKNNLTAAFSDIQRFLRWRVSLMEKGVAMLDFENVDQLLQVHDYEGVSLSDRTPESKNAASEATSIFAGHYPEFLYKKFMVNVPTLLTWIFWLFKPLIPAQTFAKMSVVGTGSHVIGKSLLPYVDANELPEKYGGKAKAW